MVKQTKTESNSESLSIDLEIIHNPNPMLVQTYEDAKATPMWFDRNMRPEYVNEERIFAAARASKKSIKHNIFSLYRKQVGSREFVYLFDHCVAKDYFQNNVDHTRLIGKWDRPVITQKHGINVHSLRSDSQPESGPIGDPEVESVEEVYDYPWEQMRDQLIKWKESGI